MERGNRIFNYKIGVLTLFILMFLVPNVYSFNFPEEVKAAGTIVNINFGNLTNLSQMSDTNIPAPNDNDVLSWDDATQFWIATAAAAVGNTIWGIDGLTLINNTNGNLEVNKSYTNFSISLYINETGLAGDTNWTRAALDANWNDTGYIDQQLNSVNTSANIQNLINGTNIFLEQMNASQVCIFDICLSNWDGVNVTGTENTIWFIDEVSIINESAKLTVNNSFLNFTISLHNNASLSFIDTNISEKFDNLTASTCGSGKAIGVQTNGSLTCAADITGTGGKEGASPWLNNDTGNIILNITNVSLHFNQTQTLINSNDTWTSTANATVNARLDELNTTEAIQNLINGTNIFLEQMNSSQICIFDICISNWNGVNQTFTDTNSRWGLDNLTLVNNSDGVLEVNKTYLNGTISQYINLSTSPNLTNVAFTNETNDFELNQSFPNITVRESIYLADANHIISRGSPVVNGIAENAFSFHHEEIHAGGTIGFIVTANSTNGINRTMIATQVGRNNSASILGNSWMVVPNNLTSNLTVFTDCFLVADQLGETLKVACDTFDTGSDLIVEDDIQAFGTLYAGDGVDSIGDALFVMEGNNFDIVNGSLHLRTPRTEQIGVDAGENFTQFQYNFENDVLDPFLLTASDNVLTEWQSVSEVQCHNSPCASAGSSVTTTIEVNFTTLNAENLTLSFYVTETNLDAPDTFDIIFNDNAGSGDITEVTVTDIIGSTDSQINVSLTNAIDDDTIVSMRITLSVDHPLNEIVWIDDFVIQGQAQINTKANVTRFDTQILGGDGDGNEQIFYNDSLNQWIFLPGNVSFGAVTETELNVTVSITLNGTKITDWSQINKTNNATYDNYQTSLNNSAFAQLLINGTNIFLEQMNASQVCIFDICISNWDGINSSIVDTNWTRTALDANWNDTGYIDQQLNTVNTSANTQLLINNTNIWFASVNATMCIFDICITSWDSVNRTDSSNATYDAYKTSLNFTTQITVLNSTIDSVNATSNIEALGFTQGTHTVIDYTNLAWANQSNNFTGFNNFMNNTNMTNNNITGIDCLVGTSGGLIC